MELLLKLYYDRPSRIGLRYTYGYQARQAYEALVKKHGQERFRMKLEPVNGKLRLSLKAEYSGQHISYNELEYRPDLLRQLERLSSNEPQLQFVHLYREANQLLIAKPFGKQSFFNVSGYEIVGTSLYKF